MAKAKKKPFNKLSKSRETVSGRSLYIEISPVKKRSKGGNKFWLQIADDATPKKWSFFLSKKSDQ